MARRARSSSDCANPMVSPCSQPTWRRTQTLVRRAWLQALLCRESALKAFYLSGGNLRATGLVLTIAVLRRA